MAQAKAKAAGRSTRAVRSGKKKPRVGIIGVGAMGLPMAGHLLKAKLPVAAFDLGKKQRDAAARLGAAVAGSAAEVAAASDVVLVIVPTDQDVIDCCLGTGGVLEGAARGTVIAICSSIMPDTAVTVAKAAAKKGVGVLDSPMTKGVQGAVEGNMTILAGGAEKDFAKARPAFVPFSAGIHLVGPIGAGSIAKTANNLVIWSTILTVKEVFELGARYGVAPAKMREALMDCSADSWVMQEFPRIIPTWPRKDLDIALKLADNVEMHMPIAGLSRGLLTHMTADDIQRTLKLKPRK